MSETWQNYVRSIKGKAVPIELVNKNREAAEGSILRLVEDAVLDADTARRGLQFVNFIFFRVHPDWRKLPKEEKDLLKTEFEEGFEKYRSELLMFSYSLVGFDSKADMMFWRIGNSVDAIQNMTISLFQTRLGSYLETAENFLTVTNKKTVFIAEGPEDRNHVNAGKKIYHFVYPLIVDAGKERKQKIERDALVEAGFMVGKRFPNIKIHLTRSLGFGGQDYIISFETDDPGDFLDLTEEIRGSLSGELVANGMPTFICRQRTLRECLDALG